MIHIEFRDLYCGCPSASEIAHTEREVAMRWRHRHLPSTRNRNRLHTERMLMVIGPPAPCETTEPVSRADRARPGSVWLGNSGISAASSGAGGPDACQNPSVSAPKERPAGSWGPPEAGQKFLTFR